MRRVKLEILSREDMEKIHQNSLRILSKCGCRFLAREGLEIMADLGCEVDFETQIAKIPADLVEDSLKKTPGSFNLYNRNGELAMVMEGYNNYFGGGGFPSFFDDYENESKQNK